MLGCICPLVVYAVNISFLDDNVKSVCVQNWDTDGDGELSTEEAAAVTDLRNKFGFNAEIYHFPELQYFTGLTSIESYDFYRCKNLRDIVLPPQITNIGSNSFFGCSSLQEIVIPNAVTTISENAFNGCNSMTSVTFPDELETIGEYAFNSCNSLQSLAIPSTVTSISLSAFSGCSSLTAITVDSDNTVYDSREDCNAIIKTSTNTLQLGIATTVIPSSVTAIGASAFFGNTRLLTIDIPEGVSTIDASAFSGCSSLTDVKFPTMLTSIGYTAFSGCKKLSSVMLPEGLKTIDQMAFQNCTSLKKVSIPSTVTKISYNVFAGCSKLAKVEVARTTPLSIDASVFPYRKKSTLYVPQGCLEAYKGAKVWEDFMNIVELADNIITATVNPEQMGQTANLVINLDNDDFYSYHTLQMDIKLPENFTFDADNIVLSDRCAGMTITMLSLEDNVYRLTCTSESASFTGTSGTLLTLKIVNNAASGNYEGVVQNITLTDDNSTQHTLDDATFSWSVIDYIPGDVNHDGFVNIYDVTLMIDYILDLKPTHFHVTEADMNNDDFVNIYDVTLLIDYILAKE